MEPQVLMKYNGKTIYKINIKNTDTYLKKKTNKLRSNLREPKRKWNLTFHTLNVPWNIKYTNK